jgi:undecaprenyl-diphosphatase
MTLFEAIILGIIQGITEFFPISSSGHLVLGQTFMNITTDNFFQFSVFVHIATLLAVLIYFRQIIIDTIKGVLRKDRQSLILTGCLIIATIPAVIVALTLSDAIDSFFSTPTPVFIAMICTGLVFIVGELIAKKIPKKEHPNYITALFIGIIQSIAIIPGVSRSGSTLIAGMLTGLTREKAAEFSFLMAIPAIAGAGLFATLDGLEENVKIEWGPYIAGFIASFLAGYAAIYLLMKLYKKYSLVWFAVYLLVIPIIGLIWQLQLFH